jgi:hypothetical protein
MQQPDNENQVSLPAFSQPLLGITLCCRGQTMSDTFDEDLFFDFFVRTGRLFTEVLGFFVHFSLEALFFRECRNTNHGA